jgi:hypothetical protein
LQLATRTLENRTIERDRRKRCRLSGGEIPRRKREWTKSEKKKEKTSAAMFVLIANKILI